MADATPRSRGHLNPGDPGVVFDRFTLDDDLNPLVRHVWVVRWHVPAGEELTQRVLAYPAFNVVFEHSTARAGTASPGPAAGAEPRPAAPAGRIFAPSGRISTRRLTGSGWGVGLLLRPCAGRVLLSRSGTTPGDVPPQGTVLEDAPGASAARLLTGADATGADATGGLSDMARDGLRGILSRWLRPVLELVDDRDRLVNEACLLAETDASLQRAADLAARLGVAPRTLERATRDYVGLVPKWLIECRRLQDAATTLYARPATDLSRLAAELGYADYAHLSRRYRAVLGETPRATREAGRAHAEAAAAR